MKKLNEKFVSLADFVSYAMGTPANIGFWIIAVLVWFALFALNPALARSHFLPDWFTSNAFNFPLNSITTLAELYIGFLVAAAANRSERALMKLLHDMYELIQKVETMMERQERILEKLEAEEEDVLEAVKR